MFSKQFQEYQQKIIKQLKNKKHTYKFQQQKNWKSKTSTKKKNNNTNMLEIPKIPNISERKKKSTGPGISCGRRPLVIYCSDGYISFPAHSTIAQWVSDAPVRQICWNQCFTCFKDLWCTVLKNCTPYYDPGLTIVILEDVSTTKI